MGSLRRATKRFRDSDIDASSCRGVGHGGVAGTLKPLTMGSRVCQSVSAQRGLGGCWFGNGVVRVIVIGMWSEPVEGREASHLLTRGRRERFAKARSLTEERALSAKGNLVYSPGGFMRAKPDCAAFSKEGVEEETSLV